MTAGAETAETPIKAIQAEMYAGRFEPALERLNRMLRDNPEDPEALYMAAVCARYLGRLDEAEARLVALKAAKPDFGRALQEEGHLRRATGEPARALAAYERAVRANAALSASWTAQAELLAEQGREAEAAQARAQADRLARLPKPVLAVTNHLYEGRLLKAEELCRAWLKKHPKDTEAMRLLAELGVRFGVLDDAEILLENAVAFEPGNVQLRLDYIQVLRKRQKFAAALEQARTLYEHDPENPLFQSHYAIECMQTGDYEQALALFDQVLERLPDDPATLTSRGHALKTFGRHEDAVASYRAASRVAPEHGDAFYALANLKTYTFSEDEFERMRAAEASPDLGFSQRIHLCFALGKAYEDRGEYGEAFTYYERGNALKKIETRYTADQMDQELDAQKTFCTRELFEAQGGKGHAAPDPIFIVGLPRAGSTLLEQILASHSQVDGTLELPNILSLAHSLRGRSRLTDRTRYPRILHELDAETLADYGRRYIEETSIHRKGAPFFTDKMPNNFRHVGLIKLILPNAKIIDARRHPMACCFSGFKQLFAEGQEFTYGLEEIGRYYRGYVELMDHWDAVLPGSVLRVIYEDVVDDLETQVRRLLDFCGLPFEEACLSFHETRREVRTASSEQVRQPLFTSGLEQWKRFEPWLDPLKTALGPALEDWRRDGAARTAA